MRQIVTMLLIFLIASITSGCSQKLIVVPTQCVIPQTDEPIIDTVDRNTTLGEAKRCAKNYTIYKEAYEKMKKAVEVCR